MIDYAMSSPAECAILTGPVFSATYWMFQTPAGIDTVTGRRSYEQAQTSFVGVAKCLSGLVSGVV